MAFLGSIGKAIGLGSTSQVASGLSQLASGVVGFGQGIQGVSTAFGQEQGQAVAVDAPSQTAPQETQSSSTLGMVPPTMGSSLLGTGYQAVKPFLPAAKQFLQRPITQIGIGVGGGLAVDALTGMGDAKIKVTRKQQAQVKQMVELIGIEQAASILGLSVADVAMIVTKKFRSRGQGITAAQLRTATRVNNRIIHMHDKLKSAYGTAARRTTTRRATGTRVTQIKN